MIDKVKAGWAWFTGNLSLVLLGAVGILSALLVRQNKKTQTAEAALGEEKTKEGVIINDIQQQEAKKAADSAVTDYDKLKSQYDENRTGGGS